MGKKFEDVPILVTEAIGVHEALKVATTHIIENIVVERDSQLVINSINCHVDVLILIINHVADTLNLARNFKNVYFNFCHRSQISLADRITKNRYYSYTPVYVINEFFSFK